jgi:hypothetical protein
MNCRCADRNGRLRLPQAYRNLRASRADAARVSVSSAPAVLSWAGWTDTRLPRGGHDLPAFQGQDTDRI